MTERYLYLVIPDVTDYRIEQSRLPWVPSQGDLFADDWMVYNPLV